jgi:NADH:ubiquinone oxidoreductase subunit 3 (subunit A)
MRKGIRIDGYIALFIILFVLFDCWALMLIDINVAIKVLVLLSGLILIVLLGSKLLRTGGNT